MIIEMSATQFHILMSILTLVVWFIGLIILAKISPGTLLVSVPLSLLIIAAFYDATLVGEIGIPRIVFPDFSHVLEFRLV